MANLLEEYVTCIMKEDHTSYKSRKVQAVSPQHAALVAVSLHVEILESAEAGLVPWAPTLVVLVYNPRGQVSRIDVRVKPSGS